MKIKEMKCTTRGLILIIVSLMVWTSGADQTDQQVITIDPVETTNIGDLLFLTGTTTFPPGTTLMITLISQKKCTGLCPGAASDALVQSGPKGINTWAVPIDTASFGQGEYQVNVVNVVNNTLDGFKLGENPSTKSITMTGQVLINDTVHDSSQIVTDGFITLKEIGTTHIGDRFLILGNTSLPVGTTVLWEISPDQTKAAPQYTGQYPYISSSSLVVSGDTRANRVSFALDTSDFEPCVYNISCSNNKGNLANGEWIKGEIRADMQFTVIG